MGKYNNRYQFQNLEVEIENGLSESVISSLSNLDLKEESQPSALEIIREIIKLHPEYAQNKGQELIDNAIEGSIEGGGEEEEFVNPRTDRVTFGSRKRLNEWIEEVDGLYSEHVVNVVHGRLFIIGLCLVDQDTGIRLRANEFVEKIRDEVKEKIYPDLLSSYGKNLWRRLFNIYEDHVKTHKDAPTNIDKLGRMSFARFLVDLLYQAREDTAGEDAFILHIDGAWGSGKSSLLNFLRIALEERARKKKLIQWIVVEFNAWQNQRTGPPWWSLMDTVYRQSKEAISKKSKIRAFELLLWEYGWRFRSKHSDFLLLIMITSLIIGMLIIFGIIDVSSFIPNGADSTQIADENPIGKDISYFVNSKFTGIIAFIVAIFSFFGLLRSSLMPGSSKAAKEFMELSKDPMNRIQVHFSRLVRKVKDPLIILIDDLDRCKDSYTVEFLEGIQTLFRKVNIIFVIAADRRWIYSSYEKSYEVFKSSLDRPGFPFGHLFLQKIFQLSVFMPGFSETSHETYWDTLISSKVDKNVEGMDSAEEEAERKISTLDNESKMLDEMKHGNQDPIYQQRFRQKAVERLASPEVQAQIEHMLKPFMSLLDPNPRSMKRFVNMYQIVRALDMLRGGTIEREKLALWTIMWFRWPDLAQCIEEDPRLIKNIGDPREKIQGDDNIPDKLKNLFWNQEVKNVINGEGVGTRLLEEDIKTINLYGL